MSVAGETLILTRKGYFSIQSLVDQETDTWNGQTWSQVTIKLASSQRHLITVILSNGSTLTCTPDHRLITETGPMPAQYVYPGLPLRQEHLPIVDGGDDFPHPYLHGAMCAFGCFTEAGPILDVMGPALRKILQHLEDGNTFPDDLPDPYQVPMNSSVEIKIEWLDGFLTTRSFRSKNGLMLIHVNAKLLSEIQLLLTTLNVRSYIEQSTLRKIDLSDEPMLVRNSGLLIPWVGVSTLLSLGLSHHDVGEHLPTELRVEEVIDVGRLSPTYSVTGINSQAVVLNGILTGT